MTFHRLLAIKFTLLLMLCALLLTACDRPMPDLDLTPQLNKLFSSLQNSDYETALSMYSDDFYEAIPQPVWRSTLQKFNEHMGTMESFRIRNKQSDTRFSGKFFIFKIDTFHKDQKKARHIVTFILPIDGSDVKLVGHKISAKGFN